MSQETCKHKRDQLQLQLWLLLKIAVVNYPMSGKNQPNLFYSILFLHEQVGNTVPSNRTRLSLKIDFYTCHWKIRK